MSCESLTTQQVAQRIDCSPAYVRRLAREGHIPAAKHRGRWVFDRAVIREWTAVGRPKHYVRLLEKEKEIVDWAETVQVMCVSDDELSEARAKAEEQAERYVSGAMKGRDYARMIAGLRHECTNYDELLYELQEHLHGSQSDSSLPNLFADWDDWLEWADEVCSRAHDILKMRANAEVH